jgi:GT2 family glycosyltransferase
VDASKIDSFPCADTPVVSVITVTFNSAEDIRRCLASVFRNAKDIALEHIVIDNASGDDTAGIVTTEFSQVVFVSNPVNRGLTQANNQGRDIARGRFIVFLNPDTIVPDGTFRTMAEIMDHEPDLGVLAPRLVDERGRFTPGIMGHRAPTAWTLTNGFLLLSRLSHDLFPGIHRTADVHGLEDCDWACGACLMVRREVAEAFDWRQFGSGDDFDYCIQIRENGWRVAATGDAQVVHLIGRSFTLAKPRTWAGTASNFALYLRERHGPVHTLLGIAGMRLGLRLRGSVHYLLYLATRDPERLHKVNKIRHFLAHDDYRVLRQVERSTPTSYRT